MRAQEQVLTERHGGARDLGALWYSQALGKKLKGA